jgi:hypothetical protein
MLNHENVLAQALHIQWQPSENALEIVTTLADCDQQLEACGTY